MSDLPQIKNVLDHYGIPVVESIEPLGNAGGFSGADLWRVTTPQGLFCLRKWPTREPSEQRLRWIHRTLQQAADRGLTEVPVPLPHQGRDTVLVYRRARFELTPWKPGHADFRARPSSARLRSAMNVLGRFHVAVGADAHQGRDDLGVSPGINQRLQRLRELMAGDAARITSAVAGCRDPDIRDRGRRLIDHFAGGAPFVLRQLEQAAQREVPLQPCIRDIWHDHLLFTGEKVTGIVDFGAMRPDSVAADVARLVGSLAGDCHHTWSAALAHYETRRQLSPGERQLVQAFDRSGVLMSGLTWLQWICVEGRQFENWPGVLGRLDDNLARLDDLGRTMGAPGPQ